MREARQTAGAAGRTALILRSAALFGILFQARLLAADLADTPVFTVTLTAAFMLPWILVRKRIPPLPGSLILILLPWATRTLIALPRFFRSGPAVTLDALLLNLDRNNFVSLLPFYWAALTTYFSLRSRRFLRGDIIAADILLVMLFYITGTSRIEIYRWPVLMISLFALIIFLQLLALMLSMPAEYRPGRAEGIRAGAAFFALVLIGSLALIGPSQERALDQGGGLLQPDLFSFDFSQFLRLESEISMNEDLVFIVRKDADDPHIFLRRFVLSGYGKKQGFFRQDPVDEVNHPQRLPEGRTVREIEPIRNYRVTGQEYYLVNFDASAFIAMKEPALIIPFDTWDASSFSSAYGVQSHTSEVYPLELIGAVREAPGPADLGLSPEEYAFYTDYGADGEIATYARQITGALRGYWEQVQAVYDHLKFGEYRYSLKPGLASGGDQLKHFLFTAKKGYCSYFAFSMALLLRSLGIPARVAVGFYIDPRLNTFDYYPVRADMAHAWVEVRYPEYGWIEYDPTTRITAEDEEFRPPSELAPDTFERLLKEILDNHSRLVPREQSGEEAPLSALASLGERTRRFILNYWGYIVAAVYLLILFVIRLGPLAASILETKPRKKAERLWAHTVRRLALAGYRKKPSRTPGEWAANPGGDPAPEPFGAYPLYQCVSAARYAPAYGEEDFRAMGECYALFVRRYTSAVSPGRRILAWLLPPLALTLGPARYRTGKASMIFLVLILLVGTGGSEAQNGLEQADTLFDEARRAQEGEFWERAIELYGRGAERYPQDIRFPWALGDLYFSRRLYRLAREEYRKIEGLLPGSGGILYQLYQTSGYLNEDKAAAAYLERFLEIQPDDQEGINRLGWMYYKLHRLGEGERLLRAAIERLGTDADLSMTLGTIYSDMFRYEDAKKWYLEAINRGEAAGDREFSAVAHYNLAILESRFYRFADALERTNLSLNALNRASGRLMRGELYLRRLDIPRTIGEYQAAYEIDTSSLSKVNLAQTFQIAGRLEEARLYAEDSLRQGDLSWMLNYGIDPIRYRRDLHEILYKSYAGLAETEARRIYGSLGDGLRALARRASCRFKAALHRRLFAKYSLLSAQAYTADTEGQDHPEALLLYYDAFKTYPRRALSYLREAWNFEFPINPLSEASYRAKEGTLLKNRALLTDALARFDPGWERDMIADVYAELALIRGGGEEKREAAERLYALNPGALRQRGIALPLELTTKGPNPISGTALRRALKKAGMDASAPGTKRRFRLSISHENLSADCELYDVGRGSVVFRRQIPLRDPAQNLDVFAGTLGDLVFTVE
jgi:transglutaminase-like putative cysteine protease/tetratricopeptide (TPR) repeat protein